jgi:pimeloyl-ACP methyl ester carboxylesterase
VGGSKGAELALLLATRYPDIHLVATFVPSHVVFQGTDIALFSHHSSWQYHGKELPFVPYNPFSWAALKGVLSGENYRDMHLQALENKNAVRRATIPVEKINGPIFLLSATQDQFWPSTPMSEAIMQRLASHHFPFPYQHLAWNSNHFILRDPKAWNALLDFLQRRWPTHIHKINPHQN